MFLQRITEEEDNDNSGTYVPPGTSTSSKSKSSSSKSSSSKSKSSSSKSTKKQKKPKKYTKQRGKGKRKQSKKHKQKKQKVAACPPHNFIENSCTWNRQFGTKDSPRECFNYDECENTIGTYSQFHICQKCKKEFLCKTCGRTWINSESDEDDDISSIKSDEDLSDSMDY